MFYLFLYRSYYTIEEVSASQRDVIEISFLSFGAVFNIVLCTCSTHRRVLRNVTNVASGRSSFVLCGATTLRRLIETNICGEDDRFENAGDETWSGTWGGIFYFIISLLLILSIIVIWKLHKLCISLTLCWNWTENFRWENFLCIYRNNTFLTTAKITSS